MRKEIDCIALRSGAEFGTLRISNGIGRVVREMGMNRIRPGLLAILTWQVVLNYSMLLAHGASYRNFS